MSDTLRRPGGRREAGRHCGWGIVLVLLMLGVGGAGCVPLLAPIAVGAGEVAATSYWRAEHNGYVDVPLSVCAHAVEETARYYNLRRERRVATDDGLEFLLRNAEDVPFRIRVEPLASRCTRVSIRAGVWGDKVCSEKLMAEIRRRTK